MRGTTVHRLKRPKRLRTSRKWSATQELWMAEAKLRHKAVVGAVVKGRVGIGSPPSLQYNKAQGKEMSQLV